MRVFYAIEFSEELKQKLHLLQKELKSCISDGVFTSFENAHLTIRYLGEVPNDKLDVLFKIADDSTKDFSEISMKLGGLGVFPKGSKNIIWTDVMCNRSILEQLKHKLDTNLLKYGFEKEPTDFVPHVTLARKAVLDDDIISKFNSFSTNQFTITHLTLFQSHRLDGVLTYTPIYRSYFLKE
jgi:2'-5' RNA ligase